MPVGAARTGLFGAGLGGAPIVVSVVEVELDHIDNTFNVPGVTAASGDILVALLQTGSTFGGSIGSLSGQGWTLLTGSFGSENSRVAAWQRRSSSVSDGSFSVSMNPNTSTAHAQVWRITRAHQTQAVEIQHSTTGGLDPPSLSPSWGAKPALWLAFCITVGSGTFGITAAPSGYEDFVETGSRIGAAVRRRTAASEDPGAFTGEDRAYRAGTIAVRGR